MDEDLAVRFFGEAPEPAPDAAPQRPLLTAVLHGADEGEVPADAVEKWRRSPNASQSESIGNERTWGVISSRGERHAIDGEGARPSQVEAANTSIASQSTAARAATPAIPARTIRLAPLRALAARTRTNDMAPKIEEIDDCLSKIPRRVEEFTGEDGTVRRDPTAPSRIFIGADPLHGPASGGVS